jgi:hypothetical protein
MLSLLAGPGRLERDLMPSPWSSLLMLLLLLSLVVWASASPRSTHWHYLHHPRRRRERRAACPSAHRRRLALLEHADAQCAFHEPMRLGHQAASHALN